MKHGVILVGCGAMGGVHATALARESGVRLVSAVDTDPERAERFRRDFGFERSATDYRQELAQDDFDIVLMATHWWNRVEMVSHCFDAGKHVLAEKPLSLYLDEVDLLFGLARERGLKLRVGLMERFRPMFHKISDLLAEGRIGRPRVYSFIHHQRPSPANMEAGWRYFKTLMRGGVTPNIDCGIHKCDLVRLFSGSDPVSVLSVGQKLESDTPANNYTHSLFTLADGATATIEDCWSGNTESMIHMWMIGDRGRILFEYSGAEARPNPGSQEDCIRVWHRDPPHTETFHTPLAIKPVAPQMAAFVREIEEDADMEWHYRNVRKATEMAVATVLSEHRGRPVAFPLSDADLAEVRERIQR